jgi:hypothetical protein
MRVWITPYVVRRAYLGIWAVWVVSPLLGARSVEKFGEFALGTAKFVVY